jgi:ABC-type Fe3+/spermidine/putrescine transport system ATPase subunit
MLLEIEHLSKSYPGLPVLHDVSLMAADGEIMCLLGPSGCGKSTLLRIVAGLETPDIGRVIFDGQEMAGVPPHRRRFGLMFQDYALFPHKDVAGNVAFGLRMARLPGPEIGRRVGEALALVGLSGYARRRVTELSGGEQQRVALARSLAPRPRLLMLDEPLGALDRALREQLMNDLRAILKQVGVTALYVTHDQEEAFAIADRIAILQARPEAGEGGHIEQVGAPQEVYRRPASAYVARFLGFRNLVDGRVVGPWQGAEPGRRGGQVTRRQGDAGMGEGAPPLVVETPLGALVAADLTAEFAAGEPVTVLIRPEAAQICASAEAQEFNSIRGRLCERSFRGSYARIQVEHASGITLTCDAAAGDQAAGEIGDMLRLHLASSAISLLKP